MGITPRTALAAVALAAWIAPCAGQEAPRPVGRLAFASQRSGNGQIYLAEPGGEIRRLTDDSANDGWPDWSPDGSALAYHSIRRTRSVIVIARVDEGTEAQLALPASLTGYAWEPDWSPDGLWIAFSLQPPRGSSDIYAVRPDGSDLRRLTSNAFLDGAPRWSPDGASIAFFSDRDGDWEIYRMGPDGSGAANLTRHEAKDYGPSWSPDGTMIAFVSDRDGDEEIYAMGADGSSPVRLTASPGPDFDPCWSPDGSAIVFASERDGDADLYLLPAPRRGEAPDPRAAEPARLTDDRSADYGPAPAPARGRK